MKVLSLCCLVAVLALLVSCGGGGGGATQTPQQQPVVIPLSMQTTALGIGIVSSLYGEQIKMQGGTAPYHFIADGNLPPGLALSADGNVSGTPTMAGSFTFSVVGSDSAASAQSVTRSFTVPVGTKQIVRNDDPASADTLTCCGTIHASFSPYSTAAGVAKPDQDYYRIAANPGDHISIDAVAVGTAVDTDTVLEVVDTNGARMQICQLPGEPLSAFIHYCMNDDLLAGVATNSHLDLQLPPGGNGVFIVHVVDWGGRARPEMTYDIKMTKIP